MQKLSIATATLGLLGILLGAFGAHAFKDALVTRGTLQVWETAALYHLVHATGLLALIAWRKGDGEPRAGTRDWLRVAGWCWVWGVVLFSGSLYLLALGGPRFLGPVTPLGGVAFIAGWVGILIFSTRPSPSSAQR